MDLYKVSQMNMYLLRMVDNPNARFYGQFTDIPNTTRVSNFNEARRLLRVKPSCNVKSGDNIYDPNGNIHLVADHGDQFLVGKSLFTHYKLFVMEEEKATVRRAGVVTINPVTLEEQVGEATEIASIYLAHEMRSTGSDDLDGTVRRHQIITGFKLEPDDVLTIHGQQAVVEVSHDALGVTIAHIVYK